VKSEVAAPAALPASRQPFTLAAGAFLSPKHQRETEKKIRHLGYTPKVQTTFSMVPMTRLRLGVYDPATAKVRSQELSAQIPGLFAVKQGDKVALYAGSYQSLDQARSFADQLYLRGIHVDEETVSLRMPLKKITFGSFASRAAAEKAAKRVAAAGLTAQVVKR
jgi:cell division septation protein DedD